MRSPAIRPGARVPARWDGDASPATGRTERRRAFISRSIGEGGLHAPGGDGLAGDDLTPGAVGRPGQALGPPILGDRDQLADRDGTLGPRTPVGVDRFSPHGPVRRA